MARIISAIIMGSILISGGREWTTRGYENGDIILMAQEVLTVWKKKYVYGQYIQLTLFY